MCVENEDIYCHSEARNSILDLNQRIHNWRYFGAISIWLATFSITHLSKTTSLSQLNLDDVELHEVLYFIPLLLHRVLIVNEKVSLIHLTEIR